MARPVLAVTNDDPKPVTMLPILPAERAAMIIGHLVTLSEDPRLHQWERDLVRGMANAATIQLNGIICEHIHAERT